MMTTPSHFVVIFDQHGGAIVMSEDEDRLSISLFDTIQEAEEAGNDNALARACGFEIHTLGGGCG